MSPDKAKHDLTLVLIYLSRMADRKSDFWRDDINFQAWKNYSWETVDALDEEGLVISKHGNKSLWLTPEGVAKAREVMEKLNISDWTEADIS